MRFNEPRWRDSLHLFHMAPPTSARAWLLDRNSLTRRLCETCPGVFRVHVLYQGWTRPLRSEARALELGGGQLAFIREALLLCNEAPWVFARSVVPAKTLSGHLRRVTRLGARPLGALLFAPKSMRRGSLEVARITPGTPLFEAVVCATGQELAEIWGRRSVFQKEDQRVLVSELFLPSLLCSGES
jgi:chorismate--pyruvate lyase